MIDLQFLNCVFRINFITDRMEWAIEHIDRMGNDRLPKIERDEKPTG